MKETKTVIIVIAAIGIAIIGGTFLYMTGIHIKQIACYIECKESY